MTVSPSLILRAMNYEEVGHCNAKEFKKTGQFALSHVIATMSKVSEDVIQPQKLVALLEFSSHHCTYP